MAARPLVGRTFWTWRGPPRRSDSSGLDLGPPRDSATRRRVARCVGVVDRAQRTGRGNDPGQAGTYVSAVPFRNRPSSPRWPRRSTRFPAGGSSWGSAPAGTNPSSGPSACRSSGDSTGSRRAANHHLDAADRPLGSRGRLDTAHAPARATRPAAGGLPVMVGASGSRMLRLTAELADEWNAGMRSPEDLGATARQGRRLVRRRRTGSDDPREIGGDADRDR